MSDMLEQAVIDAAALKEVALKNAEEAVVEKYSKEIKEAVDQLLEQDDVLGSGLGMELDSMTTETIPEIVQEMPLAATDGEDLCGCPDMDNDGQPEEITIDFTELEKQMPEAATQTHEAAADEVLATAPEVPIAEDVDFNLEELEELVEELTVDINPTPSGWGNNGIPNSHLEEIEDQLLALAQDSEVKEELEELNKTLEELEESKNNLQNLQKDLNNSNKNIVDLQEAVEFLKNKLNETNLVNAKLLFKNKALMDPSLNERQKEKIAEALSTAETVEEAKIIYDTLQSTVRTSRDNKKSVESLSEAVNKVSSTMILTRNEKVQDKKDSTLGRWKTLAGLNNKI
jgi:hypothetical protein